MKKIFTLMAVCLLALVSGCGGQQSSAPEPADKGPVELYVSAAASLTDVMNEIGKAYEQEHPDVKVVFNYGSSGALQQAIENGGAADLFFSAAQKQMDALDKQGLLADGTREELLQNEVVLIVPKEGGRGITSFDALTGDAVAHVALGEPKGVPVGQYSEEILTKLGLLDGIRVKAVYGSDVRQVLAWVASGEADAGLVYATDAAVEPSVRVVATAPAGTHKPIIYPAAVLKDTKHLDTAKDFLAFVSNDKNKERFAKYGFEVK